MRPPLILGIAGGTGSGKTTVVRAIASALGADATHLDHDSYYADKSHLSPEARRAVNYDHPEALDNALLGDHLEALRRGMAIEKPVYDFAHHSRSSETVRVAPAPVILVEGILTLAIPELRDLFDLKVFVDTADDIRLMRRIRRDLEQRGRSFEEVRSQYFATVRPMHMAFVEPSKQHADLIIPEGGENRRGIAVVVGHVRDRLRQASWPSHAQDDARPYEPPLVPQGAQTVDHTRP